MNIYLGIFRKIYETSSIFTLVSQLWTKTTYFNYLIPGDAAVKESENDLTSFLPSPIETGKNYALYNTTAWIDSAGLNGIALTSRRSNEALSYSALEQHPPLTAPPTPYYYFNKHQRAVEGNKSYVSRLGDDNNQQIGGVHLEDDGIGGLLIVAYLFRVNTFGQDYVQIYRYSTTYNESIDQATILDFVDNGTPDYDGILNEDNVQKPFTIDGGAESIDDLVASNRQLCCDSTGRKIVFFANSFDSAIQAVIFEAVDTGTAINITKHSDIDVSQIYVGEPTTEDLTGGYVANINNLENTSNGSGNGTGVINFGAGGFVNRVFLGVAYSRYDDSLLILSRQHNTASASPSVTTYTLTSSSNSVSGSVDITKDFTMESHYTDPNGASSDIIYINDDPLTTEMQGYDNASGTGTETQTICNFASCTSTNNRSSRSVNLISFSSIDLSAMLFVYEIETEEINNSGGDTRDCNPGFGSYYGISTTTTANKIMVHANGVDTVASEISSTTDPVDTSGGSRTLVIDSGVCSGPGCGNTSAPDAIYTITYTYIDIDSSTQQPVCT